ncbi:hypothetical protein FOC1_g10006644 [Fusarium oxysporum f. sp. cubense race 1]|uniref:Pentatricopeptide repeat domain-containing protein n=1 Tax=Fusarium oxysporum f. sp. cubense (strain race 1) TaxID=1229664 RepID=N4U2M7_FUSC1|nr:hypothetical protein FOC1_g10006644 [Fusarium oxysporum f. sp. cubense race 1]
MHRIPTQFRIRQSTYTRYIRTLTQHRSQYNTELAPALTRIYEKDDRLISDREAGGGTRQHNLQQETSQWPPKPELPFPLGIRLRGSEQDTPSGLNSDLDAISSFERRILTSRQDRGDQGTWKTFLELQDRDQSHLLTKTGALFLRDNILEAALTNSDRMEELFKVAGQLLETHDFNWPELYLKVVHFYLAHADYETALGWHFKLMPMFRPDLDSFGALLASCAIDFTPKLQSTLTKIYVFSPYPRWFASSWTSSEFAINLMHKIGLRTISYYSLQSIALREDDAHGVADRLKQLRKLGIEIRSGAYCNAIISFAERGEDDLLRTLLHCDIHPEEFGNPETRSTLLASSAQRQDWGLERLLQEVEGVAATPGPSKDNIISKDLNKHLSMALSMKHLAKVRNVVDRMDSLDKYHKRSKNRNDPNYAFRIPADLPFTNRQHPIQKIFDISLQRAIVRWGFDQTLAQQPIQPSLANTKPVGIADFDLACGVRLLAVLRDKGVYVDPQIVRSTVINRLAVARLPMRPRARARDDRELSPANMKRLVEGAWGSQILPNEAQLASEIEKQKPKLWKSYPRLFEKSYDNDDRISSSKPHASRTKEKG